MRPGLPRLLATLLFLATAGCVVHHPARFNTPLETVLSFQSAFAADDEIAEYRCLSQRLKRAEGLTLQAYGTLRPRMFQSLGSMGRFFLRRNSLENNVESEQRADREAALTFSVLRQRFTVPLRQELSLWLQPGDGGPLWGGPLDADSFRLGVPIALAREVQLQVELPATLVDRLESHGLQSLELAAQWRIDAPLASAGATEGPAQEAPKANGPAIERTVSHLPWQPRERVLAHVIIEFTLPLEAEDVRRLSRHGVPVTEGRVRWSTRGAPSP